MYVVQADDLPVQNNNMEVNYQIMENLAIVFKILYVLSVRL